MSTDFSSIDRLVEFGMGLAIAQQMVNTMNSAMNQMQIPGVNAGTTGRARIETIQPPSKQWYAVINDHMAGPLTDKGVQDLAASGSLLKSTLMWRPGLSGWQQACELPEIYKLILMYGQR